MKRPGLWMAGAAVVLAAALAAYRWPAGFLHPASTTAASPAAPAARPVPVTAGIVRSEEFSISRTGLGTVQAYNTVTMKVRVDGEVQKIAFHEGQDVQVGDVLAQIDPRPYEAQLHQAEADKARDEAPRANAKPELERCRSLVGKEFATRQSVDTPKALAAQYQAAIARDQAVIDNARLRPPHHPTRP